MMMMMMMMMTMIVTSHLQYMCSRTNIF